MGRGSYLIIACLFLVIVMVQVWQLQALRVQVRQNGRQINLKKVKSIKRVRQYIVKCCGYQTCIPTSSKKNLTTALKSSRTSNVVLFSAKITPQALASKEIVDTSVSTNELSKSESAADTADTDPVENVPTTKEQTAATKARKASAPSESMENPTVTVSIPFTSSSSEAISHQAITTAVEIPALIASATPPHRTNRTQAEFAATETLAATPTTSIAVTNAAVVTTAAALLATNVTNSATTTMSNLLVWGPECQVDVPLNASLFDAIGKLKVPERYGAWMTIGNEQLLFGKKIGSWIDNRRFCFEIGMKPLTFLSLDKFKAFNTTAATWKLNKRYWTSGKKFDNVTFGFCPLNNATVGWMGGKPPTSNPDAMCVLLNFTLASAMAIDGKLETKRGQTHLTNGYCEKKFFFACEGPVTNGNATTPNYPNITCVKNARSRVSVFEGFVNLFCWQMANFKSMPDITILYLIAPATHGHFHTLKGRTYMFSKVDDKRTYLKAIEACCAVGMQLLDLHQTFIYDNLVQIMQANLTAITPDLFWTAGSDDGSEGHFVFATTNNILTKDAKWKSGQPDNAGGAEHCLAVDISGTAYAFTDESCTATKRYVCMVKDTVKSTTGGRHAQKECALNFGLTEDSLPDLMASFIASGAATDQLKCFMKCMGELTALVQNNNLNDEKFLRMLEAMYDTDEAKLEKGLMDYDYCSNLDGLNDCDRLAKQHKCGVDKDPELVANMMQAADVNTPLQLSPLLSTEAVCPEYTSTINEEKMIAFKRNQLATTYSLCNRKYLYLPELVYQPNGAAICASHGLKLVSLDSAAVIKCLLQIIPASKTSLYHLSAVSRLGNPNKPRHCFSTAPFNPKLFTWAAGAPNTTSFYYVMIFEVTATKIQLAHGNDVGWLICEE